MDVAAAQQLLLGVAEEALSGRAADVMCMEAPESPPLPESLRRELDGRSVYTRPGTAVRRRRTAVAGGAAGRSRGADADHPLDS